MFDHWGGLNTMFHILSNYNSVPISTRVLHTLDVIKKSVGKVIICVKSKKVISKLIKKILLLRFKEFVNRLL